VKSYFHKEGSSYISIGLFLSFLTFIVFAFNPQTWLLIAFAISFLFLIFSLQFFRYPNRPNKNLQSNEIISPADGKLVVHELLDDGTLQLSIFMSPLNVHANWIPISGHVTRSEYIAGKYLVAWHPKSSTENERHEIDLTVLNNQSITVKQIAGAVARRIICYLEEGDDVNRGGELGFIKFGSRVDVIVPSSAEVLVKRDDKIVGNQTVLARLKR